MVVNLDRQHGCCGSAVGAEPSQTITAHCRGVRHSSERSSASNLGRYQCHQRRQKSKSQSTDSGQSLQRCGVLRSLFSLPFFGAGSISGQSAAVCCSITAILSFQSTSVYYPAQVLIKRMHMTYLQISIRAMHFYIAAQTAVINKNSEYDCQIQFFT